MELHNDSTAHAKKDVMLVALRHARLEWHLLPSAWTFVEVKCGGCDAFVSVSQCAIGLQTKNQVQKVRA